MSERLVGFVLLVSGLSACVGSFDLYSPSQIHRTVKALRSGLYVVDYEWPYVIENYGPDMEKVLQGVDERDMPAQWDRALSIAVPKYLVAKGLVPAECVHGVTVVRSGEGEGGKGWAEFRCKQKKPGSAPSSY
jgi:hypothetical protein